MENITAAGEAVHKAPRPDLGEIGHSGLIANAGRIDEEILRQLKGSKEFKAYREMQDNSAVIGAELFAIKQLARGVAWDVVPFAEENAEQEQADYVHEVLFGNDMSQSWEATLSEILSFLTFGFSYHEIVWKMRSGDNRDPQRRSKFNDGRVGIRKLAGRAQESLDRWIFDPEGGVQAFVQVPEVDFQARTIPIEKSLLFRTEAGKGNPQGRSILRNAYTSYYRQNHIQNIEGIAIERDLAGMPLIYLPPNLFGATAGSAEAAAFAEYRDIVTNVRRDEMEGLLLPAVFDERGNRLYEFVLASSGGRRQFDTDAIVNRYDKRIAMTVLADFILLGQEAVGSKALSVDKTEIFMMSLAAYLDAVEEVLNNHLLPRLFRLNGFPVDRLPRVTHGKVQKVNLNEFGQFIGQLAGAGAPLFPNAELETYLAELGGYPPPAEQETL